MGEKKYVSVESVQLAKSVLNDVNKIPFGDIIWTKDGKEIPISQDVADEWRFVGMSNACFVEHYLSADDDTRKHVAMILLGTPLPGKLAVKEVA